MKAYYLVLRSKGGRFYAFYMEVGEPPAYDFDSPFAVGYTVKEVLKAARKFQPDDGYVAYTYLDNS
jgi:hypothetical protein